MKNDGNITIFGFVNGVCIERLYLIGRSSYELDCDCYYAFFRAPWNAVKAYAMGSTLGFLYLVISIL
jgi:hypothetical protein